MKRVYISSTYKDLVDYRSAAHAAIRKMGHEVLCMEDYVAKDERTDERCMNDAASCDIYIGIFAWRYGFVPMNHNPQHKSITELEYRAAVESDKTTVLVFLLAEDVPWLRDMMDSSTGENERGKRIQDLHDELKTRSPTLFRSPDDLATQVVAAVYQSASIIPVHDIALFENMRSLDMDGSLLPDIEAVIKEAETSDLVRVNLGIGESWWTTRLHLAAALATDFTSIQQLVFVDNDGKLIGIYSPAQVRQALATAFPFVEFAYLNGCQRSTCSGEFLVSTVVMNFECCLDETLDDKSEYDIKEWVTPDAMTNWMTKKNGADFVPLTGQPQTLLQHQIVNCTSPFVALVENGRLVRIIDRNSMVTHLAKKVVEQQFR